MGDFPGQDERVCTINSNTILRNTYIDQTGSLKTYPVPGYIGGIPSRALFTVYEVAYYVPSTPKGFESWAEDTAKRPLNNKLRRNSWIDEYIENGMLYEIPENLKNSTSEKYLENTPDINKAAYESIVAAITNEMSIHDAIEQYRTIAKSLGVKEILDFENAKLGKTTDQKH